jgi:hypothetical protein
VRYANGWKRAVYATSEEDAMKNGEDLELFIRYLFIYRYLLILAGIVMVFFSYKLLSKTSGKVPSYAPGPDQVSFTYGTSRAVVKFFKPGLFFALLGAAISGLPIAASDIDQDGNNGSPQA